MRSHKSDAEQRDRFKLIDKIGKGSYGTVFRAIDTKRFSDNDVDADARNNSISSNKEGNSGGTGVDFHSFVAIKIINLEDAADEIEQIHQEITIMSNISCPQLTKYYSSFITGKVILGSILPPAVLLLLIAIIITMFINLLSNHDFVIHKAMLMIAPQCFIYITLQLA